MSRPVQIAALDDTLVRVGNPGAVKVTAAHLMNIAAAVTFVQFFEARLATDITLGTTVPDYTLGAGIGLPNEQTTLRLMFAKGLFVAATTTAGGLTAPSVGVPVSFGVDDG